MMPAEERWTVTLPGAISDIVLAEELRRRGWHCSKVLAQWQSCEAIAEKVGMTRSAFSRLLVGRGYNLPGLEVVRARNSKGQPGKVVRVRPSAEFFEFMGYIPPVAARKVAA